MNKLRVMVMPNFDSVRESLDYEVYDDYDTEAILYQQGYDGEVVEIEDQEIFRINEGYIGQLLEGDEEDEKDNDKTICLKFKSDDDDEEEHRFDGDLVVGRYQFLAKQNAVLCLDR